MQQTHDLPLLKFVIALLMFGSNGILAHYISLDSFQIVLFRTFFGCITLLLLMKLCKHPFTFLQHKRSFIFLILSGVSIGISWLFLYEAYQQIGVNIASLIFYCGPVLVMAASPLLFKEKLTRQKMICFMVVFAGIILINSRALQDQHTKSGLITSALSAFMFACMIAFNKKTSPITGMENAAFQMTFAFLTVLIVVAFKQGLSFYIPQGDFLPILALGVLNTGFGSYLYFSAISTINVQTVALVGYVEPLSAVIFSFLILKEQLLPLQILGALLITLGAILSEIKKPIPFKLLPRS